MSVDKIGIGDDLKIGIKARSDKEWHINSHKHGDEFLIPTLVEVEPFERLAFGYMYYPEGKMKRFSFSPDPISVYAGDVLAWSKVRATKSLNLSLVKQRSRACSGYQAYLKGRYFEQKRDEENLRKALDYYRAADRSPPNVAKYSIEEVMPGKKCLLLIIKELYLNSYELIAILR